MNQILVTEKLYVTPELKRKKKVYQSSFIISIFLIVMLCSAYVYAQYDRNKSEELSQDILASIIIEQENLMQENIEDSIIQEDTTTISKDDEVWVIDLQATQEDDYEPKVSVTEIKTPSTKKEETKKKATGKYTAPDGTTYKTIGTISIPSIDVKYPILSETTDKLLKVSVCKFWGAEPNEVGNLCVAGHNYRNTKFFSKVPKMKKGDIIEITDLTGTKVKYKVYKNYTVDPEDVSCTSQLTNGKRVVTLITCTNNSKKRVVIKAEAI